jgi:hypothetical protein
VPCIRCALKDKRMSSTPITLDLPACGMYALFYCGVYKQLLLDGSMSIRRIYGRSSGAIAGALMCCDITDSSGILERVQHYNHSLRIVDSWAAALADMLPADAHKRCSGRLFITTAWCGVLPCTVSTFTDNAHLLEMIVASGRIPLVTTKTFGLHLDGLFVDRFTTVSTGPFPVLSIRPPLSCWPLSQILSARSGIHDMARTIDIGANMTRDFCRSDRSPTKHFTLR